MSRSASETWCGRVGGWGLLIWLIGGLALEGFNGFKLAPYLQDGLRRQMWTLAHAHGTVLSVVCLVFAWAGPIASLPERRAKTSDRLFSSGSVLLPLGFLLGGMWHSEADPGIGILFVPIGGLLAAAGLVVAILPTGSQGGRSRIS